MVLSYSSQHYDFILCEGSDYLERISAFEFNLNAEIAKNLSCPIILLGSADRRSITEAILPVKISLKSYLAKECQVLGLIFNKVASELLTSFSTALETEFGNTDYLLSAIPYEAKLSSPRVREIVQQLNAKVLYGHDKLDNLVLGYVIAAMQLEHVITRLKENSLVITPGDRSDLLLGLLQADQSVNYPHLSGILLSGDLQPEESVRKLIDGLYNPMPILSLPTDTYETSELVKQVNTSLVVDDREKINLSIHLFDQYVNLSQLEEQINTIKVKGITPKMFTYNLLQQAKSQKRHIVLPEGQEIRILRAATYQSKRN